MTRHVAMTVGYPGCGKSSFVHTFLKDQAAKVSSNYRAREKGEAEVECSDYLILNRDTAGGSIAKLVKELDRLLTVTKKSVLLDNTHCTAESRKAAIAVAKKHDVKVVCYWLDASFEDSMLNSTLRIVKTYGHILTPEECKEASKKDPHAYPPAVLYHFRKAFQEPALEEGFAEVISVPFKRQVIGSKKALILDYDGTLRDTKSGDIYPTRIDDIRILPNRTETLQKYVEKGYLLLGVSNQSGIHKGLLSAEQARLLFQETNRLLGHDIDFRFCPHQSNPIVCWCRKPSTGHAAELIVKYDLNPAQCIMVGDMTTDETFATRSGFQYQDAGEFFAQGE